MFSKILRWILGIFLMAIGMLLMRTPWFLAGLILIIIGMTFIPKLRDIAYKKTNINLSKGIRKGIYSILWIALFGSMMHTSMQEAQIKAEKDKQLLAEQQKIRLAKQKEQLDKRSEYFQRNREEVIQKIKDLGAEMEYAKGVKVASLYVQTKDEELLALKKKFQALHQQARVDKRSEVILAQLKKIPASQIEKNFNLYKELHEMHPKNERYEKKMNHYGGKIAKMKAQKAAEERFYGEKPMRSGWDGSYLVVERYLKRVMHDPSSLDVDNCTYAHKVKNVGWVVGCRYRGKNKFGGLVLNENWFVIRQNRVVGVKDPKEFSFQ